MALMDIIEYIRNKVEELSSKDIKVTGIVLEPTHKDKNLSCYTDIDLSRPELIDINREMFGGSMKVPCIYSKKYISLSKNPKMVKRPVKDECGDCKFSLSDADYFKISVTGYCRQMSQEEYTPILHQAIISANIKFDINIKTCTAKIKSRRVIDFDG